MAPKSHQDALAVRAIADELAVEPLCVKCIATRRGFTRFAVESIIEELRRALVVDTLRSCAGCGGPGALTLNTRVA
jgi:hypothetical protein